MRRLTFAFFAAALTFAAAPIPAAAKILITVDKTTQQMTVAVDGVRRWQWPVSTGMRGHTTPSGRFTAFRMEKDHFSKEWDDAPMPHSIFFTPKGHAIHGSLATRRLGQPASHGCVRLAPANAAKLFALVQQQGVASATVVITASAAAPRPRAPERDVEPDYAPRYESNGPWGVPPGGYQRAPQGMPQGPWGW
ncbi:MAG: hypothetical protein QOD94_1456 [Alphaproteobacteria bacterium]|jgi:lipoprotein-anchoring transpeptidase ErfK/SrfK|nr:hypothetical protein [Alphaproteobacteria bacterium]